MPQPRPAPIPTAIASALPAVAVAAVLAARFWNTEPQSDGGAFFTYASSTWDFPLKLENFWASWAHKESYASTALLGLTYRVGLDPINAFHLLQFGLCVCAMVAFSVLCHRLFGRITTLDASLLTLAFAITPAYVAYTVNFALDFVAVTFLLLYLAALCTRRFPAAVPFGLAFAFSKETCFLTYSLTLPVVLLYSLPRFGPMDSSWPNLTRAAFFLPYLLKAMHHLASDTEDTATVVAFCQQDSLAGFLFSPNLGRPEIQNYLFDLFCLNFQWLLLLPCAAGLAELMRRLVRDRAALTANRERVNAPALALVMAFLAAGLYVTTRCPVWNNVKYILQLIPLWLLVAYWLSAYGLPTAALRAVFLGALIALLGVSTVRSLDPLSLRFFGSFEGGSHTMLCMNSRDRPPEERMCGNDELIYNLQPFLP